MYVSLILSSFVHMTNAVSTSGKGLIDLNSSPPASPRSGEGGQSQTINLQEAVQPESTRQISLPDSKPTIYRKSRSIQFEKVKKDDKRIKYQFPPGTTYHEKKRVWRREYLKRIVCLAYLY